MASFFSTICEMNLLDPPQPCSHHRSHRVEFQFSDSSRFQIFVCGRHAADTDAIAKALLMSGQFLEKTELARTDVQHLESISLRKAGCLPVALATAE
jgi:hypothetical protein